MPEELSIVYFRNLLEKNQTELKGFCEDWEKLGNNSEVPELVCDEIRVTIGLTNLLLQQKLKQFADLIDDSEFKRGEKEITCLDLQGFWDMVYNEVEKIQKKFHNLKKCQLNDWVFVEESITKKEPKKKLVVASTAKLTTDAKARALAARQRLAEAKLKMKAQMLKKSEKLSDEQVSITLKENVPQEKLEVDPKIQEVSDSSESKIVEETKSPIKRALKNIKNLNVSEQDDLSLKSEIPSKKLALTEMSKGHNKKQKSLKKQKENFKNKEDCSVPEMQKKKELSFYFVQKWNPYLFLELKAYSGEKLSTVSLKSKKGSRKEFIPLQCVTRSAKRALLTNMKH